MDLSSSLTVIGWFVQVLLDQGITFALDHWGGAGAAPDLPAALERLREVINNVRALLPIAQKIRSENEGLLESGKDLKDAAYDAEDILSELDYYRLQEEAEGNDNSNNSSFGSSMIEAAGGFLSQLLPTNEDSQASTSSPPPSVFDNKVTIIPRIYEVVARLDRIVSGVSRVLALLKPEEELDAELSKKIHIRNLRLIWKDSQTLPEVAEEVFEGIRPPAYIKKLFIDGYGGVNTPSWMVHEIRCFSNLQSLDLLNCLKWKDLPPLGQLPSLRRLVIKKADAVEVIDRGFYGTGDAKGFQCLETLEFVCMPQLVEWSRIGDDSGFLFPRLSELTVKRCPKLKQVPMKDLTSLKELHTSCMPLLVHPEYHLSLEILSIIGFEEPLLPVSVELKSFPSLKQVTLESCNRFQSLPLLPAMLEVLRLRYLELLTDLTMEHLTSLRELYI